MSTEFAIIPLTIGTAIWHSIAGHHTNLAYGIFEFADNGISSFAGRGTALIVIFIQQLNESGDIMISVEDNGTGLQDINTAMSLGKVDKSLNTLNMYGMGTKQALASINPSNDNWTICSRTEADVSAGVFKRIKAPYSSEIFYGEIVDDEPWPGTGTGTGTIVSFVCDSSFFKTLTQALTKVKDDFLTISDILYEEIGHTYSKLIENGTVKFIYKVKPYNKPEEVYVVDPIKQKWNIDKFNSGSETVDLGNGPVTLQFSVGTIQQLPDRKLFDNKTSRLYYKEKITSSGCEISLNGRIIRSNIFHDVWPQQRHNKYNKFLMTVDVISNDIDKLPPPQTTKIDFIKGDIRLETLYSWIRSIQPNPICEEPTINIETRLFQELERKKKEYAKIKGNICIIIRNQRVFKTLGDDGEGVYADMYEKDTNGIAIYEGKRGASHPLSVYQLRMYWDGLVKDGIKPFVGILLAKKHPKNVLNIIEYLNHLKDSKGNRYNFKLKTWKDYDIDVNVIAKTSHKPR